MKDKPETEAERFSKLVTGLLKVPHAEIKEKLEEYKRERKRKKRVKTLPASHGPDASD